MKMSKEGVLINLMRYQEKKAAKARKDLKIQKKFYECMNFMKEKAERPGKNEDILAEDSNGRVDENKKILKEDNDEVLN
jgi:hypothetical protein